MIVVQSTQAIVKLNGKYVTHLNFQMVLPKDLQEIFEVIQLNYNFKAEWDGRKCGEVLPIVKAMVMYMIEKKQDIIVKDFFGHEHNKAKYELITKLLNELFGALAIHRDDYVTILSEEPEKQ